MFASIVLKITTFVNTNTMNGTLTKVATTVQSSGSSVDFVLTLLDTYYWK